MAVRNGNDNPSENAAENQQEVCRQQIKHIPYGIFSVRQFQQCWQDLQAVSERKSPMKNFKSIKSDFKTII